VIDWEDILRIHGPAVWRTLFRLLGNRADADECFQETFLTALQFSRRQTIAHWPAWLQRVATSRAIDRLRQRPRHHTDSDSEIIDSVASAVGDVSQPAENAESAEQLRRAMALLPSNQAEAIGLHALLGWSYQEIGRELGLSPNAVGVLIHRGKRRLRELLEDSLGARPGGVA
jgi:RNA polymerase sigma-70 factor (ECF subfamily)